MPKTLITPNIKTVKKGNITLIVCGSKPFKAPKNIVVGAKSGMKTTVVVDPAAKPKPKAKAKKKATKK